MLSCGKDKQTQTQAVRGKKSDEERSDRNKQNEGKEGERMKVQTTGLMF